MKTQKIRIFVSAAFTGKTWEQVTQERKELHKLAESFGMKIVEQFIGYQGKDDFENKDYNPSFILAKDKNFIKESDAFVIDLRELSLGASCELTIAKELFDKKVYAVIPDKKRKKHPWVRFYCDFVLDSFEEAFQKIKNDFSGKTLQHAIDKRQYDPIATEYRLVEETPAQKYVYDPEIIDIIKKYAKEKSVIVLHGGSGYRARLARKAGASKVTCIDISYKQTQIGRLEEEKEPLGIDFLVLNPYSKDFLSSLPKDIIGSVDVVLGAFLLDHAMTLDELKIISKNIKELLSKDGIFFGISDHPEVHTPTDPKYGVVVNFEKGSYKNIDGASRRISIYQKINGRYMEVLHFHNFRWKQKTIYNILSQAGFSSIKLDIAKVSKEGIKKLGKDFWSSYNKNPSVLTILAKNN
jgi:SAM-dependent methyltransferase